MNEVSKLAQRIAEEFRGIHSRMAAIESELGIVLPPEESVDELPEDWPAGAPYVPVPEGYAVVNEGFLVDGNTGENFSVSVSLAGTPNNDVYKAFDGNLNTYWYANTTRASNRFAMSLSDERKDYMHAVQIAGVDGQAPTNMSFLLDGASYGSNNMITDPSEVSLFVLDDPDDPWYDGNPEWHTFNTLSIFVNGTFDGGAVGGQAKISFVRVLKRLDAIS